ncbi:MAG TPA: two-component regulator propeller domain-containing protein, partial [Herpetosiphonaceae bacterium]
MPVAATRRLCLLLALLLAGLAAPAARPAAAQPGSARPSRALRFRHLSATEGLANNHVEAVAFDRQGFAWIGTWDGLSRYDGHAATTYRNNPQDPASLSSNVISAILEDRQGALWVATRDAGLNRFDPATGGFARFLDQGAGNHAIHSLAQDAAGALWLGRENGGLTRFDPATGQATFFQPAGQEPSGRQPAMHGPVWDLWTDPAGAVWLAGGAVARFDPASATLTVYGIGEKTEATLEPRAADQPPGPPG